MSQFTFLANDLAATAKLGRALAELLPDGTALALNGPLGAGKTRLVQALAESCGVDRREVVSPTFVLAHHYHGRRTIYHLDAYRLTSDAEFLDLGTDEYFASGGLTIVEWAERVVDCLPEERIDIRIEVVGPTSRRFILTSHGSRYAGVVEKLKAALGE